MTQNVIKVFSLYLVS